MTYDKLLEYAENENVIVKEMILPKKLKGLYVDNCIAINKIINTDIEKKCILAEELGHYHTSTGNILDLSDIRNAKQELQARVWSYNRQVGLIGIIRAFENGCNNIYEMAEFLNITEEFLSDALAYYKNKYGISTELDNYVIYFEPNLYVAKSFK